MDIPCNNEWLLDDDKVALLRHFERLFGLYKDIFCNFWDI